MEFANDISTTWILIFILTGFTAGYIDAIAGGGGMITIPMLLFSGLPPILVLGTNKLQSVVGVFMATIKYAISKKINWKIVSIAMLPCLIASYIGSQFVMFLSDEIIQWAILLSIPIALLTLLKKNNKIKEENTQLTKRNIILATAPIGFYDGLLGPGTGTYLTISMKKFLHLDYLTSTASTKPLNFATNFGSVLAFLIAGKILFFIAIPMGLANMAGSYVGSHYAIKGGEEFIKKVLIFVLTTMLLANIVKIILG
ncbi:MAG: putative membrane protein YfcA [Sulfurimonas sp.]|jgi:uncharacterized membrane protein YfcA